ncbi:MAG: phosphodiester glycosidase family protein [Chitinophagaceae bacterium]|nr:phosphodiester glycosidase family protein [Chitinophagaceae bacterium]
MRFILPVLLFISASLNAQLRWKNVNSDFGSLPPSVNVFKTTDSLSSRPFVAYYIEAKLSDRQLDFSTQVGNGKRYSPSEFYTMEDSPLVVVNGTFFSFQTNQNLNTVIREGKMVAYNVPALKSKNGDSFYYPTRSAIGITRDRRVDVAWLFTDTAKQWPYAFQQRPIVAKGKTPDPSFEDLSTLDNWRWWRMYTAIGGGPVLLQDGKVTITNRQEQMFVNGLNDRHPRTAMGYTKKGKLIILMIEGRAPGIADGATLLQEAQILQSLGCVEALNLDGGGSSCMLVNGQITINPSDKTGQRQVPAVFMIKWIKNPASR